jgi:hypothetical protein
MTVILAFDQSLTRTGWALMAGTQFDPGTTITGSFHSDDIGDFIERVAELIEDTDPTVVIWEAPLMVIFQYGKKQLVGPDMFTPNADQLKLHHLHGALLALTRGRMRLYVPPKTWRKAILGDGRLDKARAKAAAKQHCQRIHLPQPNHDQAEAVCLGLYAQASPEVKYRHQLKGGAI